MFSITSLVTSTWRTMPVSSNGWDARGTIPCEHRCFGAHLIAPSVPQAPPHPGSGAGAAASSRPRSSPGSCLHPVGHPVARTPRASAGELQRPEAREGLPPPRSWSCQAYRDEGGAGAPPSYGAGVGLPGGSAQDSMKLSTLGPATMALAMVIEGSPFQASRRSVKNECVVPGPESSTKQSRRS